MTFLATVALTATMTLAEDKPLPANKTERPATNAEATETVGVTVDAKRVIGQQLYPKENACVPASLLNALRFGPKTHQAAFERLPGKTDKDKLLHIIEKYGVLPSQVEKRDIFNEKGVLADDIPLFLNAILKDFEGEAVDGMYFDRAKDESWPEFLRRVHGKLVHSLSAGFPVVVSVRSFGAVKHDDKFLWEGLGAHAIVITRVPKKLQSYQQGFAFEFIEPSKPSLREGYLYCEEVRSFQAIKGAGQKDFKWLDNSFLTITAPSLNIETNKQPWYARTFLMLNYGVGKFSKE
jgi:hypothetical protein